MLDTGNPQPQWLLGEIAPELKEVSQSQPVSSW
jgi:hypothetical protein